MLLACLILSSLAEFGIILWSERSACAALGINVGSHLWLGFRYFPTFLGVLVVLTPVVKIPERVVAGFQIFA
jgi:hypothetical protein